MAESRSSLRYQHIDPVGGAFSVKFPIKSAVWLFVAALVASASLFVQGHPMPGSSSAPPVICALCGGKPTFPYSAPIVSHRGRYLDSTRVRLVQGNPVRTYRAERVAIASELDRVYMKIGSTFVSYKLSTFFARDLAGGMTSIGGRDPGELYLPFLDSVYPETSSEWVTLFQDGQERLGPGFDCDDRGYVYIPARIFGWGIVQDVGNMQFVKQYGGPLGGAGTDVNPYGIISFKHEGKYYAYVWDLGNEKGSLFDVTSPAAAVFLKSLNHNIAFPAKATVAGEQVIGYADLATGSIKIFSASRFIAGATAPDKEIARPSASAPFAGIDSDGTRFFAAGGSVNTPGTLAIIAPSGN